MTEHGDVPRLRFGLADLVIVIVVGFLFAASLFAAVGNLVSLPGVLDELGIGAATPWPTLVLSVLAPPVLFVGAILLGRGRGTFPRTLVLVVAVAANSALALSLTAIGLAQIPV